MNWLMLWVPTQTLERAATGQRDPLKASSTAQLLRDPLIHPPLSEGPKELPPLSSLCSHSTCL